MYFLSDIEIIETFDRGDYRQSGSSMDSNNEKKKKNQKLFKFGMFKYDIFNYLSSKNIKSPGRFVISVVSH